MDPVSIIGGGGLTKGWNEMKFAPGLHAKTAIRFDYNRFNTIVSAIEGGINAEYYFKDIDQMVYNPTRKFSSMPMFPSYLANGSKRVIFAFR